MWTPPRLFQAPPEVVSEGVFHSTATRSLTETTSPVYAPHSAPEVAVLQPRKGPDRLTRDENIRYPSVSFPRGLFEPR